MPRIEYRRGAERLTDSFNRSSAAGNVRPKGLTEMEGNFPRDSSSLQSGWRGPLGSDEVSLGA